MGADYWSQSVPADVHERVDVVVRSWLEAKGFEEIGDEPLFDLDKEIERGFFLFWNDRWTVVVYSDLEEVERLTFELAGKLELPVLQLWAHDSDLWGYELHGDGYGLNDRPYHLLV